MADTFQIVNGDVQISQMNGRPTLVSGSTKFNQDMGEILSTDPPVGAGLDNLIGLVPLDPLTLTTAADIQVRNAAARYQTLQQTDSITPRTPQEILSTIAFLQFIQDPSNPTDYLFQVDFLSQQGSTVPLVGILGAGQGQST